MARVVTRETQIAEAMACEVANIEHRMSVIANCDRLIAKVRAMPVVKAVTHIVEVGKAMLIGYGTWRAYVESLDTTYVKGTVNSEAVKIYCVHCGMATDVATAQRIGIGALVKFNTVEQVFDRITNEWEEEERKVIRPAIHMALGCPDCQWAYARAQGNAKRLTTRIRFDHDGVKKTLYARDTNHGASLLAEHMGKVTLLECKSIPPRNGFLDVSEKAVELAKARKAENAKA